MAVYYSTLQRVSNIYDHSMYHQSASSAMMNHHRHDSDDDEVDGDDEGDDPVHLTAKPHVFAGAVLSPKHARVLTPSLCIAIVTALSEQSKKIVIPYTLWITEAWRVLGWAEPSAALFWELATMYHALFLAGRAVAAEYEEHVRQNQAAAQYQSQQQHHPYHPSPHPHHQPHHQHQSSIPPILSCGSTSSLGSGTASQIESKNRKLQSTAASAKELPVWLIGIFLLVHCEDLAYQRNLSGEDTCRFFQNDARGGTGAKMSGRMLPKKTTSSSGNKVDFTSLLQHPSLSPRTRLHAGWLTDYSHCTAYLLRHLRKILLMTAVPHNPDAVHACMHLAALSGSAAPPQPLEHQRSRRLLSSSSSRYNLDELRRQHDEEHQQVGLSVELTLDDLERLHLILQPPHGGGIEDPPVRVGTTLWEALHQGSPPPMAKLSMAEVEREVRRHLEMELLHVFDDKRKNDNGDAARAATSALAKLNLSDSRGNANKDSDTDAERAKQPSEVNQYQKELSYTNLRGTTILLKPNPTETSSGASAASGEQFPSMMSNNHWMSAQRLHDLAIADCSDAHFYLLQPFEHATISGCTNCTIVVGAVAGLLHIVDCEKTQITCAARRVLVSNSCDACIYLFSPSPPLLVGDNRTCQFAPYNTYYDGLREDLLATGLAAAVMPENQSPYLGNTNNNNGGGANSTAGGGGNASTASRFDNDAAWPPLQCASNKWKQPIEMSKLEMPAVMSNTSTTTPSSPGSTSGTGQASPPSPVGADDKAMGKPGSGNDATMQAPILLPASEFHILYVPVESDAARQVREAEENEAAAAMATTAPEGDGTASTPPPPPPPVESQYCRLLAEVLQLSPFRLPVEYERRVLTKADRMRAIQQAVQKNLTPEQQQRFEEELNRGFRDWLVSSGNLRQVLDLVHLERRGGV